MSGKCIDPKEPHLRNLLAIRAPMAVWRNGAAARAVDMMDNARALPTCPQPQQQQTEFLAA
jgi:putative transposase